MKTFEIYWLTGKTEYIKGHDITDALQRAGYSGDIEAMEHYEQVRIFTANPEKEWDELRKAGMVGIFTREEWEKHKKTIITVIIIMFIIGLLAAFLIPGDPADFWSRF